MGVTPILIKIRIKKIKNTASVTQWGVLNTYSGSSAGFRHKDFLMGPKKFPNYLFVEVLLKF